MVTRADILRTPSGFVTRQNVTTAHQHLAHFYLAAERAAPRISWTDRIARAPSVFAVDGLIDDFFLFGSHHASAKATARVLETARVRRCELRGELP